MARNSSFCTEMYMNLLSQAVQAFSLL
uniref:Uncharacterized protein n=1 Tax=Anguilla anguilla TaxID=7936 RepID=A0A0E9VFE8_ANGAN